MLYSESRRLAFLHIHKCGGLSLRAALLETVDDLTDLTELPGPHHKLHELFPVIESRGIDPATITVVTSVCHPAAHAVSIYEFWRSPRSDGESDQPHIALTRRLEFPEFLAQVLTYDGIERALAVEGVIPPNVTVLRRERLAEQTRDFVREELGRSTRLTVPHANRTPHAPVESYYHDDETMERLKASYAWTFAMGLYDPDVIPAEGTGDAGVWSRLRVRAGQLGRG